MALEVTNFFALIIAHGSISGANLCRFKNLMRTISDEARML